MAVVLPLEAFAYSHDHRGEISVDVDCEEGSTVTLTLGFEPGEFLYPENVISVGGVPPTDVSRNLLPSEARSLAAMLLHFAREADS